MSFYSSGSWNQSLFDELVPVWPLDLCICTFSTYERDHRIWKEVEKIYKNIFLSSFPYFPSYEFDLGYVHWFFFFFSLKFCLTPLHLLSHSDFLTNKSDPKFCIQSIYERMSTKVKIKKMDIALLYKKLWAQNF